MPSNKTKNFSKKISIGILLAAASTPSFATPVGPLITPNDKGEPVIAPGSILRTPIDAKKNTYFDELLELNLLTYEIGKDFRGLDPARRAFMYHLDTSPPSTPTAAGAGALERPRVTSLKALLDTASHLPRKRRNDVIPFSHTSDFIKRRFNSKEGTSLNYRPRHFYVIKGHSGIVRGADEKAGELDFPGVVSFDPANLLISVAVRGSQGAMDAPDWTTNFGKGRFEGSKVIGERFNGSVHEGFSLKVNELKPSLFATLHHILDPMSEEKRSSVRIFFTGHSQGAALSVITAAATVHYMKTHSALMGMPSGVNYDNLNENRIQSYRFASPRVFGDKAAVESMDKLLGRNNDIRQNVKGDIVTQIPTGPSLISRGFWSYGYLAYERSTRWHLELHEEAAKACERGRIRVERVVGTACAVHDAVCRRSAGTAASTVPYIMGSLWWAADKVISIPKTAWKAAGRAASFLSEGIWSQHRLPLERHWELIIGDPIAPQTVQEKRPDFNELLLAGMSKRTGNPVPQAAGPAAAAQPQDLDQYDDADSDLDDDARAAQARQIEELEASPEDSSGEAKGAADEAS